jgi:hypothetical protein
MSIIISAGCVPPAIMSIPIRAYCLSLVSLLAGAATVHAVAAPDLRLPLARVAEQKGLPLPADTPAAPPKRTQP